MIAKKSRRRLLDKPDSALGGRWRVSSWIARQSEPQVIDATKAVFSARFATPISLKRGFPSQRIPQGHRTQKSSQARLNQPPKHPPAKILSKTPCFIRIFRDFFWSFPESPA
ncbi:MAG: hypothetical protein R3F11_06270 [Verrucomicrobiales bacterium]